MSRTILYCAYWWLAHAGIYAVPTYGMLRSSGTGNVPLMLALAITLVGSATIGRILEGLRKIAWGPAVRMPTVTRGLYLLATHGVTFAVCTLGWDDLSPSPHA